METFPPPPPTDELRRVGIGAHLQVLPAGAALWRIYFRGGQYPTTWSAFRTFGPVATARFDHHEPPPHEQERAILYVATEGPICLAEVFQLSRVIDRFTGAPWLVSFRLTADLHLLDLTGLWPTAAGGSQEINSGNRQMARQWSRAIYAAFPAIQGLWYRSKMYGSMPAMALYERARRTLPAQPSFHTALASAAIFDLLDAAAAHMGYTLI